jgi:hypothetical protein
MSEPLCALHINAHGEECFVVGGFAKATHCCAIQLHYFVRSWFTAVHGSKCSDPADDSRTLSVNEVCTNSA